MALLRHKSAAEIAKEYTHYGLIYGIYPVYVAMDDNGGANVASRNWWPETLLRLVLWFGERLFTNYPILLTRCIHH